MSWQIDPATGDYVMTDGKPTDDDSLIYPAYYRTKITRGRWLHAPDSNYGSDYGNLNGRVQTTSRSSIVTIQKQALQPMIDDGRALAIDVTLDAVQPTLRSNASQQVKITSAEGITETLTLPPVGD